MIKVSDIAKQIKEGGLSKDKLEELYDHITSASAVSEERMADLEKAEAIYLNECGEKTRSGAEMKWNVTTEGQEQISLKRNIRALDKLRSSIKHRIFNTY